MTAEVATHIEALLVEIHDLLAWLPPAYAVLLVFVGVCVALLAACVYNGFRSV